MALSERTRNQLYQYFSTTELGEEAISEMLSYFPARDVEEPVTKEFLRGELALVRLELHNEIDGLRQELNDKIDSQVGALRTEMRQQFFWLMSTILVVLGVLSALIVTVR